MTRARFLDLLDRTSPAWPIAFAIALLAFLVLGGGCKAGDVTVSGDSVDAIAEATASRVDALATADAERIDALDASVAALAQRASAQLALSQPAMAPGYGRSVAVPDDMPPSSAAPVDARSVDRMSWVLGGALVVGAVGVGFLALQALRARRG